MEGEEMLDSGYTPDQLDAITNELTKGVEFSWPEEDLAIAMTIGLSDGDTVELSERGTVLLPTSRTDLDERITSIRASIADGTPPREAILEVCG